MSDTTYQKSKKNGNRPTVDKEGKAPTLGLKRHLEKLNMTEYEKFLLRKGLI